MNTNYTNAYKLYSLCHAIIQHALSTSAVDMLLKKKYSHFKGMLNKAYTNPIKFVILLCIEKINQGKALD